jgi:hypothetical protein
MPTTMPTMPTTTNLLSLITYIYRSLLNLVFFMATIALLALPNQMNNTDITKNGILLTALTITAPFLVVFLATTLHLLVPSGKYLKFGFVFYVVSIVSTANYIGMCIDHLS